jgi:hypothetical protein
MAKSSKKDTAQDIDTYITTLEHPLKKLVEKLHEVILDSDKEIAAQVKWNSPSYYYTGAMKDFDPKEYKRDIVVLNLHKPEYVLMVFPTGSAIADTTGLLGGKFKDTRKTIQFTSVEELMSRKKDLQQVLKLWLSQVEK